MSPSRAEWLRSPHLARAEGGPEALATFRRLPEVEQREIVRFGDALAETSLALAQAYALRAPRARARMDRERCPLWGKLAVDIASGTLANREAAAAFLRLDPVATASCPPALLERWLHLAGSVQALSRKLATLFLEGSGPELPSLHENARARLEQWAEAGIHLASGSGWRGEFLAAAFYSSGAAVLPVLSGDEIRRWAALGAAVQVGRELGQGFFQGLPDGFAALSAAERATVFELCAAAIPRTPRAAASLFAGLPGELARIDSSDRSPLLRALVPAAVDAEAVLGLLPLLKAILRTIPEGARRAVLERVAESGARLPF